MNPQPTQMRTNDARHAEPRPGLPGGERDATRLLVVDPCARRTRDAAIGALPQLVAAGDLLVLNDAATLPASLRARTEAGAALELRLLGPGHGDEFAAVAFGAGDYRKRTEDRPPPPELVPGSWLQIRGGLRAQVIERRAPSPRLLGLRFDRRGPQLWRALYAAGQPIQYAHQRAPLSLFSVQTLYASRPWAAEMPSAGRPLSSRTLTALRRNGVELATLTHAAGLSATGDRALDQALPLPERYEIPRRTAAAIARTDRRGGRVIAVGTSVVRALEDAALRGSGRVSAGAATAHLRIGPGFRPQIVAGLLTGIHAPGESHFDLLQAFVAPDFLRACHVRALRLGYRNHEFGDASLILAGVLADTTR